MDELVSEFYVTLPSNASMNYFPGNTQSSYRTKLSSPIRLGESWEVGLAEIFIPRNWFNISDHNNQYSLTFDKEITNVIDHKSHTITFTYEPEKNIYDIFAEVNEKIRETTEGSENVLFIPDLDENTITIAIREGFELSLTTPDSSKLLFMLYFNDEDVVLTKTVERRFRSSSDKNTITFFIEDKRPLSSKSHIVPFTAIKPITNDSRKVNIFTGILKNIEDLDLKKYMTFDYDPIEGMLEIRASDYAEIHITKKNAQSFLHVIDQTEDIVIKNFQSFKVNPLQPIDAGNSISLIVKEYPQIKRMKRITETLYINGGIYKTADDLFKQFREIRMFQLPDFKVALYVPETYEVTFTKALADMLGFTEQHFTRGSYNSTYPLELHAGITEIMVYSDILESHHVGDAHVPLLRIIPCLNEKGDQIVKHYEKPIYFPLKKQFLDTIEIELRTSSGQNIIFTGGKTIVCLSFRRKSNNL